jgi:hypothetical protein
MSCHVMSCHVMSCHVMSCHVMSCHVMSCHVMSCHVMSCHVTSRHVTSRHVTSRHVTSYHIISYIIPYIMYISRDQSQSSLEKRQLSSCRCLMQIICQPVFLWGPKIWKFLGHIWPTGHPPSAEVRKGWSQTSTAPVCHHDLDRDNFTYIFITQINLNALFTIYL